jgi:hypothetical protein
MRLPTSKPKPSEYQGVRIVGVSQALQIIGSA